jgi:hypothetical protein
MGDGRKVGLVGFADSLFSLPHSAEAESATAWAE